MEVSTAALLGSFVGGIFGVFVLFSIWEWALFKRVTNDPVFGKVGSVVAAYITAILIYGTLSAGEGSFNSSGILTYFPGFLIVGAYAFRRGMKLRDTPFVPDADTFS